LDDRGFQDKVDEEFARIEDKIDELELDIDVDLSGGVVTFTFENESQVILSRQIANHEIWVAAKSGGFHLRAELDGWHCDTTDENLETLLNRVFMEQAGLSIF